MVESSGHSLAIQTQLAPTAYSMPSGNVTGSAVLVNNGTGDFVGTIPYMTSNGTFVINGAERVRRSRVRPG